LKKPTKFMHFLASYIVKSLPSTMSAVSLRRK